MTNAELATGLERKARSLERADFMEAAMLCRLAAKRLHAMANAREILFFGWHATHPVKVIEAALAALEASET